jgi:single-stranded-DNA-specific exonuclease
MTGENRAFAKMGLKILRKKSKLGFRLLIPKEKLSTFEISNIVFEIAPKINAAGRISHGKAAVELMVSDNLKQATQIVEEIMELNEERRGLDMSSTQSALNQITETKQTENFTTVVYNPNWNKGVIGIVASRLTESHYKPTLVFTDGNDNEIVASARSISDFDLHEALEMCSEYFLKFGGHPAAAGLSMEKSKFEDFKIKFEKVVASKIKDHQKNPTITIDAVIDIGTLNKDFFNFHRKLAPFGPQNMKPILVLKNQISTGVVKLMGKDGNHLKFYIPNDISGRNMECVGFKLGNRLDDFKNKSFDIAFTVEENHWKGNITYFLNIRDVIFH